LHKCSNSTAYVQSKRKSSPRLQIFLSPCLPTIFLEAQSRLPLPAITNAQCAFHLNHRPPRDGAPPHPHEMNEVSLSPEVLDRRPQGIRLEGRIVDISKYFVAIPSRHVISKYRQPAITTNLIKSYTPATGLGQHYHLLYSYINHNIAQERHK